MDVARSVQLGSSYHVNASYLSKKKGARGILAVSVSYVLWEQTNVLILAQDNIRLYKVRRLTFSLELQEPDRQLEP